MTPLDAAALPRAGSPAVMRLPAEGLQGTASALFAAAGLDREKAERVAELLVLTDMLGRPTHGLAQCGAYLDELISCGMTRSGSPEVVRDTGPTLVWDGGYLPGLWLMHEALAECFRRVGQHGVVTMAMRQSHHIGCLAALAKQATDLGYFVFIASSGPHTKAVAPFGGKEALFSPNPFAFGFPTGGAPVLVDICASLTTISMTRERVAAGRALDHAWALDASGHPTSDPAVVEGKGVRGSLMLLGGEDAGHKGFGLALMVEALSQGLAGYGRREAPTRWGANVFLQVIDPGAFMGQDAFVAQTGFFAEACRANAPIEEGRPVRLPGDQAARSIAACETQGVPVSDVTVAALRAWAARLGVDAGGLG